MIRTVTARRPTSTRPALLTPAFVAVTLASLAYFTGDGVLIPAVPRYVQGPLGAGDVAVGLVVGAFSLSAFFLRPWAGRLGDQWGRRPLMLVGAGMFTASVLGYGLASSPETLAGLRLLTGAGEAFFFVGAITAVADLAPAQRRGEAMSLASLALYVGIGIGPLLGEVAIDWFGHAAAWMLAATAGLTAVAMALRVPDTRPDDDGHQPGGSEAPHRLVHRAGLLPGLVLFTSILGMAGFLTFVPLYALDVGMDGSRVVLLLFAAIVVGIRSLGGPDPRPARCRPGHPDRPGLLGRRARGHGCLADARGTGGRDRGLRRRHRPAHPRGHDPGRARGGIPGAGSGDRDDCLTDRLALQPPDEGSQMASTVRAAIYCRLSRTGGRSVERQEHDGRRIADENGWHVAEVFSEWESASEFARKTPENGGRKEWKRLLEGIEAGQFDAVIVWAEDRSNRDLAQGIEFARLCERAGVRLVLPSYDYDLADPEDRNRFYGEVLAAQRETARLSKRVRRARLEEAEHGRRHPGGERPFGERGRRRLPDGRTVPVVSAERAAAERASIREAAARIVAGDSLRGIVLDWNGEPGQPPPVPPPVGGRWVTQSVKRMLTSPRMAGLREHRGKLYPSTEIEPVLDQTTWQAVRAVLLDPARRVAAVGGVARHLLSGLAFCGVCGAKLEAYTRNGQAFYRCPAPAAGGRRCVKRQAAPVERLIEGALFEAVEEENPPWDKEAAELPADDPARPHHERLAALTAELDVLDRRIGEAELAEELGGTPHPSAATLRRMLADREAERDQHQAAVVRLQRGRTVAAVPRNLRAVWPKLSLDRRRNILKAVLKLPPEGKGIVIHPQGRGRDFDPDAIDPDWRA